MKGSPVRRRFLAPVLAVSPVLAFASVLAACVPQPEPPGFVPATQWDHRPEGSEWTKATLAALQAEGATLVGSVPGDIGAYCPGYAQAKPAARQAFWVGLLSYASGVESRWNAAAAGGGGRYKGLMQISDGTAAANGCATGAALYDGGRNLTCAVRILSRHVARDGEIFGGEGRGWLGVARDWLPFRKASVRQDLAAWTSRQSYCN